MSIHKNIQTTELASNPFKAIGKDWMLITAGTEDKANTMTASWGGMGVMWGKDVVFAVIRPQRYTKEFVDREKKFSLSFFDGKRDTLNYLGTVSGREEDKIQKSGLTLAFEKGIPYFEQADTVLLCHTLFEQAYEKESFLLPDIYEHWYEADDLHTLYIAEIEGVLSK